VFEAKQLCFETLIKGREAMVKGLEGFERIAALFISYAITYNCLAFVLMFVQLMAKCIRRMTKFNLFFILLIIENKALFSSLLMLRMKYCLL
jgi:hypothetical protein